MILALDVGGTKIISGLFVNNKKIIKLKKVKTDIKKPLKKIKDIINFYLKYTKNKKYKINSLKIAIAAIGNFNQGIIYNAPNMNLKSINLKEILMKTYSKNIKEIKINNDANCFALYEAQKNNTRNLVGITLGTGIGVGVIINNKIYSGRGLASELSHIIINNKQDLEDSYQNILKKNNLKGFKEFFDKIKRKKTLNKRERTILKKISEITAIMIYNVILAYDPEVVVLGGSLIKSKSLFWKETNILLRNLLKKYNLPHPKIKFDLSSTSVLKGAAIL